MRPRIATLPGALLVSLSLLAAAPAGAGSSAGPLRVDRTAPRLVGLRAYTLSPEKYAGDRRLLVTISPNGDHVRDMAKIAFTLTERATVHLRIARTLSKPEVVYEVTRAFGAGRHVFNWYPAPTISPRTYLTLLDVTDAAGNRRTYGASNAESGRKPTTPVIRVLGVDAGFTRESYVPGETATLRVETDAYALSLQMFRAGPEDVPTYNDTLMNGVPMTEPVNVGWSSLDRAGTISVPIGAWPSGVYFAKLTADDGRIGFAPFVLRPAQLGAHACRRVLPTNTWQAYNFRDENGNGWGDTWYAKGAQSTVRSAGPFSAAACRRSTASTTSASFAGSRSAASSRTTSPRPISRLLNGRHARASLRSRRLRRPHRVRDAARVRRRRALPRPRRQPDVPLGEQLLLAGSTPEAKR